MCITSLGRPFKPQQPQTLPRIDPPPGPAAGPDTVNDIPISDTGNYNRKDDLKIEKPAAQSTKTYGGAA